MHDKVSLAPDAIYDDGALYLAMGLTPATLARARRAGELRYTRKGKRILYVGQWVLDWIKADTRQEGRPVSSSTPAPDTIVPELLTTKEAARLCGIGERTLWRHSRSGAAPAPVRIGGAVRYRRSELVAWIEAGCPRCDGRALA